MNLFDNTPISQKNILPYDGDVFYLGAQMSTSVAASYFEKLLNEIAWQNDQITLFGKTITTKRKVAWYGTEPFIYTYSKTTKTALAFTAILNELKQMVELKTGHTYNSCLLNLYHSGQEGMGWHSDDEKELLKNGAIASFSFGETRKFVFKHKKTKLSVAVLLENASLLLMQGSTQTHWLHQLPPTKKISTARINLTFRYIKPQ